MTALRDLSQNAPVPTDGIADKAVTSRKNFLDVQWIAGNNNAYAAIGTGQVLMRSASLGDYLAIAYTPTVDCYWEVVPRIAITSCDGAAGTEYRGDFQVRCYRSGPVNAVGVGDHTQMTMSQRVDQARYIGRTMTALFHIAAGFTWISDVICTSVGSAWAYHQHPDYLMLYGKAWAK